jgi:hypothetical protein
LRPLPVLASFVAAIAIVDAVGVHLVRLHLPDVGVPILEIGVMWVVATLYLMWRPNPRLTEMLSYVVLWLMFSTAAAVFTYVAAAFRLPLWDGTFKAMDAALGFDTLAWKHFLGMYPRIYTLLQIDYFSLILQTSVTVLWLAHTRSEGRNASFLGAAVIGLVISTVLATLMPAVGPNPMGSPSVTGQPELNDMIAMRDGHPLVRSMAQMQGIIQFPSYHTFLAILITWSNRRLATFWPIAVVNAFMLFGIPAFGNHYLVDLFGGALVALVAIRTTAAVLPASVRDEPLPGPRAPDAIVLNGGVPHSGLAKTQTLR